MIAPIKKFVIISPFPSILILLQTNSRAKSCSRHNLFGRKHSTLYAEPLPYRGYRAVTCVCWELVVLPPSVVVRRRDARCGTTAPRTYIPPGVAHPPVTSPIHAPATPCLSSMKLRTYFSPEITPKHKSPSNSIIHETLTIQRHL